MSINPSTIRLDSRMAMLFLEAMERILTNVEREKRSGVVRALAASIGGEGKTWRTEVADACRLLKKTKKSICEETVTCILEQILSQRMCYQNAFETMKRHHEMLKQGEEVEETHYRAYADASGVTGAKAWMNDAFRTMSDIASAYYGLTDDERRRFIDAKIRPILRERRKAYFAKHCCGMPNDVQEEHRQEIESSIALPRWWRRAPLRLVDIGSCHHPFRENANFSTTALDLESSHPDVYICDFLKVAVEENLRESGRKLDALPAEYYHVAVMSLVLSYMALASQRGEAIYKARSILKKDGILIVSEAASACGRKRDYLDQTSTAIERGGFQLESPWKFCFNKVWIASFRATEKSEKPEPLFLRDGL